MAEPKSKKRKSTHSTADSTTTTIKTTTTEIDTSKPTAIFIPKTASRPYTLSLALPSSILTNAQSHDLRTHLVGTIARCAAVFCVDEIVVFNDGGAKSFQSTEMLVHILSYLETPQYLRRHLFPIHPNLKSAGVLPPLDIPSHYRMEEGGLYREGVAVDSNEKGTIVDAGLKRKVFVDVVVPKDTRLTLRFRNTEEGAGRGAKEAEHIHAEAVSPDAPRLEAGFYWGYNVRTAASLSAVFTEAPFEGGYDVTFGTSERGEDIVGLRERVPEFRHMLVAFGGLAGLEQALKADEELLSAGVKEVREVFDFWVDVCPGQGSRTIRTEEAVWIALSRLKETVEGNGVKK
ncbi:putative RNA methyltransferase [Trichophaea hybrida]|nr:putative RNA methyltransferase [Trichophaea hybrida]